MNQTYFDDDEAREDWLTEREAFERPADEDDQLPLPFEDEPPPTRFWIDSSSGLPAVKDRLQDVAVAHFITLAAAEWYMELRELGVSHSIAWMSSPEASRNEEDAA